MFSNRAHTCQVGEQRRGHDCGDPIADRAYARLVRADRLQDHAERRLRDAAQEETKTSQSVTTASTHQRKVVEVKRREEIFGVASGGRLNASSFSPPVTAVQKIKKYQIYAKINVVIAK